MDNNNNLVGVIVGAVIVIAVIAGAIWYQDRKNVEEVPEENGGAQIDVNL